MKIDTMRKIDYWVGVPLTALFTLIYKIIGLFKNRSTVKPQKLLFIELSEMGSTIIADPAMRKAKQHFNAELFFVIFARNQASLYLLNTIPKANIFCIREDNLWAFAIDVCKFIFWVRRHNIDTVFDLELFSRATMLLTALTGASNRIGFYGYHNEGLYRGELLTHRVSYNSHIHMAKNFIALVNALISNNNEMPYSKTLISDAEIKLTKVQVAPAEQQLVQSKIQKLFNDYNPERHQVILINPNASDLLPQRRWPHEHFQKLMQEILATYSDAIILITGSPGEAAEAEQLAKKINNPRCINFAGITKFVELIPLYTVSALMVTNDSGPGHFSAITDLPTIVLFGPETPTLYGSLGNSTPIFLGLACSPCVSAANHRKTPCNDNVCLKMIMPEMVMAEVKRVLG